MSFPYITIFSKRYTTCTVLIAREKRTGVVIPREKRTGFVLSYIQAISKLSVLVTWGGLESLLGFVWTPRVILGKGLLDTPWMVGSDSLLGGLDYPMGFTPATLLLFGLVHLDVILQKPVQTGSYQLLTVLVLLVGWTVPRPLTL